MRSDALNSHGYPIIIEFTDPSLNVCSLDEEKSKGIIVNETLLQICSMDEDKLCSTEENKSECAIKKKKNQIMRLHMMCRTILMPLTYSNAE